MANIVFVAKEITGDETRVAASVETVKKVKSLGFDVIVEAGAGDGVDALAAADGPAVDLHRFGTLMPALRGHPASFPT